MRPPSLNHQYRLVWCERTQSYIPVAETSATHRQTSQRRSARTAAALALSLASSLALSAPADLPMGGHIVAGSGTITSSGKTLTVNQTSDRLATNWQSFSIGQGHSVNFVQPSANAVALNRVLGADVSVIRGALNVNGQVFLINPNGVLFTSTAQVNVGKMVASTLDLKTEQFIAGDYQFAGTSGNAVINQGSITAHGSGASGGTIALIAARVRNEGTLTATSGQVLMGAGRSVTLDLGGPVTLTVTQGAIDALVEQGGAIKADGGLVYLTAKAAGDLASTVINHTGLTQAQTLVTGEKGQIFLMGGMDQERIVVSGTLDASAPQGGNGGFIETSASKVQMVPDVQISTHATDGVTGTWLLDPTDFKISAGTGAMTPNSIGASTLQDILANTNVTLATSAAGTQNGNISVDSPVSWNVNTLTLSAHSNIMINAPLNGGSDGSLALFYGQKDGAINNPATYTIKAPVSLSAGQHFSTKLGHDGVVTPYTVITALGAPGSMTGTDLQGMAGNLNGRYALGANIDAASTASWDANAGFMPIGSEASRFKGVFEGLGHTIDNLTINRPSTNYVGMFGIADEAYIQNVGLISPTITGQHVVGSLVGFNAAYVRNSHATQVNITGQTQVGGLTGSTTGAIVNSFTTGSVSGESYVGGLTGYINNFIANSFADVAVTGTGTGEQIGGLVGHAGGSLYTSYAAGKVTAAPGATYVGALAGYADYAHYGNESYWHSTVNPTLAGIGNHTPTAAQGLTTTQMQAQASFVGFDFTTPVWGKAKNVSAGFPILCGFGECVTSVYVKPNSGFSVYGSAPDLSYVLVDGTGSEFSLSNAIASGTAVYANAPDSTSAAGDYSILYASGLSLSGASAEDYALAPWAHAQTWTVTRAPLTVTANNASKTYGDANPSLSATITGFVNGESLASSGVTGSASVTTTATELTGVGSATIVAGLGNLSAGNYDFSSFNHGTLTINQRPITVTADNTSKTYGNADPVLTYQVTSGNLVNGDTLSGALNRSAGENVGSYTINASDLANGNYLITANNGTLTINQRPITVTADNASKTYGNADPVLTYQVTSGNLVNGDTLSGALNRSAGENVGSYTINASDLANGNYLITAYNGTLSITPRPTVPNQTGTVASTSPITSAPDTSSATGSASGLVFVDVNAAQPAGEQIAASSGGSAGAAWMPVFVVNGGLRLPQTAAGNNR